jgi:hypothetical protein
MPQKNLYQFRIEVDAGTGLQIIDDLIDRPWLLVGALHAERIEHTGQNGAHDGQIAGFVVDDQDGLPHDLFPQGEVQLFGQSGHAGFGAAKIKLADATNNALQLLF